MSQKEKPRQGIATNPGSKRSCSWSAPVAKRKAPSGDCNLRRGGRFCSAEPTSQKEKPRQGIATGLYSQHQHVGADTSQKEKPRQGIATPVTSGGHRSQTRGESQKEKPRQGIATVRSVPHQITKALVGRKKKSPVRGLQRPAWFDDELSVGFCVAKRKAPSGDCNAEHFADLVVGVPLEVAKRKAPSGDCNSMTSSSICGLTLCSRKKKSPVRGLQLYVTGGETITVEAQSQKEKPRQGIATSPVALDTSNWDVVAKRKAPSGDCNLVVVVPPARYDGDASQKEKPRQGIATREGLVELLDELDDASQKEKPRQGIATRHPAPHRRGGPVASQKEKPRQGIATLGPQHPHPQAENFNVAKRKAPSGDCNRGWGTVRHRANGLSSQKEKPRQGIATITIPGTDSA